MTPFGIVLVVGTVVLVLGVFLEGKRQSRIYGRPSARPNLAGAGLLELQKHLQADRRVDTLVEQVKEEAGEVREDGSGEGPETGEPGPPVSRSGRTPRRPAPRLR